MTTREGKTGLGTHEYNGGEYVITRMGDGRWYVFLAGKDLGHDFRTLHEAREWAKSHSKAQATTAMRLDRLRSSGFTDAADFAGKLNK